MIKTMLAVTSVFLLTSSKACHGCSTPGFMINIDGRDTPVFGFDSCPPDNHNKSGCTIIEPNTEVVSLIVGHKNGPAHEAWAVKRSAGITSFEAIR